MGDVGRGGGAEDASELKDSLQELLHTVSTPSSPPFLHSGIQDQGTGMYVMGMGKSVVHGSISGIWSNGL